MSGAPDSRSGAERQDTKPWYRQFWPWFLIALPMGAVIGGIITIIIAVRSADPLVTSALPVLPTVAASVESDA